MNIYVKALIPTLLVFLIGVMAGIWVDNYRVSAVRSSISESEINWNDAQLFNSYFRSLGIESCDSALGDNLRYNERIYERGLEIEKVIKNNIFTPDVIQEWKRYNLLQLQFWFNSIELKERCNFDYHTIVHLDRLQPGSKVEGADSKVQAETILNIKHKCGNKVMLIPLDVDLELISVDSVVNRYGLEKFPAVIIDENVTFQGLTSVDDLEKIIKC